MTDPLFDDLPGLLCFAKVVECQSFTKAALLLDVSKSVVSARITALEARLGERLLLRTTRKLAVTDAGRAVYAQTASMLEQAQQITRGVTGISQGVIRVNAPATFAQMYLAPPFAAFAERHPELHVELVLNDRLIDLTEERVDLAIRITKLKDSALVARRLASTTLHVCGAPSYLKTRGVPQTPAELSEHNCLRYSLLRPEEEWRLYGRDGRIPLALRSNFETSNGGVLREAAIAGIGLAMLPRFMVHEALARGKLQTVLDAHAPRPLGIFAVHAYPRNVPERVKQLIDVLVRHFRNPLW